MSELRPYILLTLCFVTGCANIPDSYAPPMQRKPLTGTEPNEMGHFVNMGADDADSYIVRDIGDRDGAWRWTHKRPELRFFLESVDKLFNTLAEKYNPFFAGPNADWLSLLPFLVLCVTLYRVGLTGIRQSARPPAPGAL